MRANKCISLLLLSPVVSPVLFTAAFQYTSSVVCNFTFSNGNQPNFLLPEAGPNSPGDQQLNEDNPITTVESNDTAVEGCNGEAASFEVGEGIWNSTFIGNDGDEDDIDVFYATYDDQLWVRTLQPHMDPSLYEALNNTIVRLNITCNDDESGCIEFTTNFTDATPYNATAPYHFNDTCFHGFSTGERVPSVKVPAASPEGPTFSSSLGSNYTIILAGKADQGLPWSEGFDADGEEKDDEFWSDWWETTHRRYGRRVSSSGDDDDARRQLELDAESDCTGSTSEVWDAKTGEWVSTFYTLDEETHDIDMFYMKEENGMNELWVTEIDQWMAPSLYNQLQYNYVKLNLECPSSTVVESCVIFEPRFTNWSPDIDGSMAGYRFSDPAVPTFDLPEAVPNSPGEVILTSGSTIVQKTGEATETNCNGDAAQYYGEDGEWYSQFIGSDGETYALEHIFYPLEANLYAATIQSVWEPNLRALLKKRTIRIRVWCTNDENAEYLFFRVSGESATCDDIEGICEESDFSGTASTVPTSGTCFMVLFVAYSWWLLSSAG